jgi:hypothetical protein
MQSGPKDVALRTPSHGATGAGNRHRRSPTGGAANGIPRHARDCIRTSPEIIPPVTVTTPGSTGMSTRRCTTGIALFYLLDVNTNYGTCIMTSAAVIERLFA